MRGSNSFINTFADNHNIRYSAKQLEYLEKHTALFLLTFFIDVYRNLGRSEVVSADIHLKPKIYDLPMLKTQVDVKILLMAWNTTQIPRTDKHCDLEGCTDSCEVGCVLICGHAYHFECFLSKLESCCRYCTDYLISGIEKNCEAFQKTLNSLGGRVNTDEIVVTKTSDDINISGEDIFLDENIDRSNIDYLLRGP